MSNGAIRGTPESYANEVKWVLDEGVFAYLGTADTGGSPHVTPVIFVHDGGRLFFLTSKVAKKLKHIQRNNRVAMLIDIHDGHDMHNNRAVLIHGRATRYTLLDTALRFRTMLRIRRLFREKYPKYMTRYAMEKNRLPGPWRTTLHLSRVLVEVKMQDCCYMRMGQVLGKGVWAE